MDWVSEVVTSEFLWGVVVGLFMAVIVAVVTSWLDTLRRRRGIAAFLQDLIENVREQIQNLEDNRDRNRVIDHEFLGTIGAEIEVYRRNREQLVLVTDRSLRNDVREFFTRTAALLAQVQIQLRMFDDAWQRAQSESEEGQRSSLADLARRHLGEAHNSCDRLRQIRMLHDDLDGRLSTFARSKHPLL